LIVLIPPPTHTNTIYSYYSTTGRHDSSYSYHYYYYYYHHHNYSHPPLVALLYRFLEVLQYFSMHLRIHLIDEILVHIPTPIEGYQRGNGGDGRRKQRRS